MQKCGYGVSGADHVREKEPITPHTRAGSPHQRVVSPLQKTGRLCERALSILDAMAKPSPLLKLILHPWTAPERLLELGANPPLTHRTHASDLRKETRTRATQNAASLRTARPR